MDTHSLQPLPFFPVPYPGESLYSILCRYHVRSGNISPHRTIRQVFGDYASLISTLLLPPMLDRFIPGQNLKTLQLNICYGTTPLSLYANYEILFHTRKALQMHPILLSSLVVLCVDGFSNP